MMQVCESRLNCLAAMKLLTGKANKYLLIVRSNKASYQHVAVPWSIPCWYLLPESGNSCCQVWCVSATTVLHAYCALQTKCSLSLLGPQLLISPHLLCSYPLGSEQCLATVIAYNEIQMAQDNKVIMRNGFLVICHYEAIYIIITLCDSIGHN